jgi:hypothetical protein
MRESKVIELIKKLFLGTFDRCSFTKMNISPIHGRGFPDLVIATEYAVFFIEAKAPGKKPTKLQRAKLMEIKAAGGDSVRCFWSSVKRGTKDTLTFRDPETNNLECEIQLPKTNPRKLKRISGS